MQARLNIVPLRPNVIPPADGRWSVEATTSLPNSHVPLDGIIGANGVLPGGSKYGLRDLYRRVTARRNGIQRAKFAGANDARLLYDALEQLKCTGVIEYTGEFGAEVTTFVPFAFWLKAQGLLRGKRVVTYGGMRPYYYFLDEDELVEKLDIRDYLPPRKRRWPSNSTWHATRQPWHVMPDYRSRYRDQGLAFAKPLLFVQNKFCVEASRGPINYVPLHELEALFERTAGLFDVVYSRPRALPRAAEYTVDMNEDCSYPDLPLARRFGHVTSLEDLCAENNKPYNLTKLEILSKCHLFVAVQGGGANLLANFGQSLLLVLHYYGHEYPHAYKLGPYKYLATPAPVLMLARRHSQFERGVQVFTSIRPGSGRLWIDRGSIRTLSHLRF